MRVDVTGGRINVKFDGGKVDAETMTTKLDEAGYSTRDVESVIVRSVVNEDG